MQEVILHLLLGMVGGNLGGLIIRSLNLGLIGNSLAGILGGVMCGHIILTTLSIAFQMNALSQALIGGMIGSILGGMLLMSLLGIVKTSLANQ